jgi:hypothetical protein
MKRIRWVVLLALGLVVAARAQTFVGVQPDCQIVFRFTAFGQTSPTSPNAGLDNRGSGCTVWAMSLAVSGFSSVTVALQSAPDNAGVPGAWVTFAGQNIISVTPHNNNPIITGTQDFVWLYGYNPWVRVALTSVTGSGNVNGVAFGWRLPSSTGSQNSVLPPLGQTTMSGSVPVVIASDQSPVQVVNSCSLFAPFNLSGSGNTQIVAASATKKIIVCSVDFATGTPEDIKFTEGTGSNCASGTADVTGLYKNISARSHDAMGLPYTATAGDALCLNQSVAQALGGTVWYRYQ